VSEYILPAQPEQTSATVYGLSESSTAPAAEPYVLKCRLERGQLRAHMLALKAMLQRQAEMEDQLFACEAGEPMVAILSRPSPRMGETGWANRFKAENLRNSHEVIDVMVANIAKTLRIDD
jgi:hypothetical protein